MDSREIEDQLDLRVGRKWPAFPCSSLRECRYSQRFTIVLPAQAVGQRRPIADRPADGRGDIAS